MLLWQLFLGHSINTTVWYQVVLFWLTVIFFVLFSIKNKVVSFYISIILGLLSLFLQYSELSARMFDCIKFPYWIDSFYVVYPVGRFIEMIPYAVLGIIMCRFSFIEKVKNHSRDAIVMSLGLLGIFLNFDVFISIEGWSYSGMYKIVMAFLNLLLFSSVPFEILPDCFRQFVNKVSTYTLGVYYMHRIVAMFIYKSFFSELFHMRVGSLHDCVIIFVICILISILLSKAPIKWISASVV